MARNGLVVTSMMGDFFIDGGPTNNAHILAASDHVGVTSIWIVSRIAVAQVASMPSAMPPGSAPRALPNSVANLSSGPGRSPDGSIGTGFAAHRSSGSTLLSAAFTALLFSLHLGFPAFGLLTRGLGGVRYFRVVLGSTSSKARSASSSSALAQQRASERGSPLP